MPSIDSINALALLLFGFGFLIFVHELGHFLVAKWVGIKVTQFAIGFGPAIAAWRKGIGVRLGSTEPDYQKQLEEAGDSLGETEYRLNWLPLGGYVKMLGQEDLDPKAGSDDPRSFTAKPVWARACVISAGVVMNLIFGVIFFIICFLNGVAFPPNMVGNVVPDSPAATTYAKGHEGEDVFRGLKPGDVITHIDDEPIEDFMAIKMAAGLAAREQAIVLTVQRDGESEPLIYPVVPTKGPDAIDNMMWIGLAPPLSLEIGRPIRDSKLPGALSRAGVEPGMKLTAVDGQAILHFHQWEKIVKDRQGDPVTATFTSTDPNARSIDVPIRAEPQLLVDEGMHHLLGMVPPIEVGQVLERMPATEVGLQQGDLLAGLGGENWPNAETLIDTTSNSSGEPLALTVLRNDKAVSLGPVTPTKEGKVGFHFGYAINSNRIAQVLAGSPLDQLKLVRGSQVVFINEHPVASYIDMQRILGQAARNALQDNPQPEDATDDDKTLFTISVTYRLNTATDPQESKQIPIDRKTAEQLASASWRPPHTSAFRGLEIPVVADGPLHATMLGIEKTHTFMLHTYVTLLRLIQGTVSVKHLRGPVGIAQLGTQIAREKGWTYLLFFLGLISVNLVVINFLPIPIVDGGLMMFLIIEKLKGSPVSVRIQSAATIVGLALIITLFVTVTVFDIPRLFDG